MSGNVPSVTVIVPAFNSRSSLRGCLEALKNQRYPSERFSITVVDDGSTDGSGEIARSLGARVLTQNNGGAASARNLGAMNAHSELILFTDADCEPPADWVAHMTAPFSDPEISGAKGFYKTRQSGLTALFVQTEYDIKCAKLKKSRYIDFIDTYSAAYRRSVFLDHGGFDTLFKGACAEDVEFSYRLAASGCKLVPVENAYVFHQHPESIFAYVRKKCRYAYWRAVAWQTHPTKALEDSYTPNAQKMEVPLSVLIILLAVITLFKPSAFSALLLTAVSLFLFNERSYFRQTRSNVPLFLAVPVFTFLRGIAGAVGVSVRLIEVLLSRRCGSFRFFR